jgi:hypothetical protein
VRSLLALALLSSLPIAIRGFTREGAGAATLPETRLSVAADSLRFPHPEHARLFVTCRVCHAGAVEPGEPLFPESSSCAACHDGRTVALMEWSGPTRLRTNLRFDHLEHGRVLAAAREETARCEACHADAGAPWMSVKPPAAPACLACHGIETTHHEAPEAACGICHVPLARADRLVEEDIRRFSVPASHRDPRFATGAHGPLATPATLTGGRSVAASCATCHARDFCVQCHVDAPEQPAIRALERDARSLLHQASLSAPTSHTARTFIVEHGMAARRAPSQCGTCHTRESCAACHAAVPRVTAELHRWSEGRSRGAVTTRHMPDSHRSDWVRGHGAQAGARPEACASCHVRRDCLDCHRPGAATAGRYHPPAFLSRHPAAAYSRETGCADCHNQTRFCADCHRQAGLVAVRTLLTGYHDAKRFFVAGHGQAARQSLETCVSCHTERDCMSCHSALGGRRFSPHGPGFDAERLARRNREMCAACHGSAIP